MSLHNKLKSVKGKGEEKTIALRIPKGRALILEKLAEYYELNTSALIREMIDDALIKLQKDLIVLPESLGLNIKLGEQEEIVTYLPEVMELLSEDLGHHYFKLEDFCNNVEAYENFIIEDARLTVKHGMASGYDGSTPITKKEYSFQKEKK